MEAQKPTLWLFTFKAGNAEAQTTAMTMKMERRGCDDIFIKHKKSLVTRIEDKLHEVFLLTILSPRA